MTGFVVERNFRFIPYTNLSLLQGKTSNGREVKAHLVIHNNDKFKDLSGMCNDLIKGHAYEKQTSLCRTFIDIWRPMLKGALPAGCSYFTPKHLGGFGLPLLGAWTGRRSPISFLQKKFAGYLSKNIKQQNEIVSMSTLDPNTSVSLYKGAVKRIDQWLRGCDLMVVNKCDVEDELLNVAIAEELSCCEYKDIQEEVKSFNRLTFFQESFRRSWNAMKKSKVDALTRYQRLINHPKALIPICPFEFIQQHVDLRAF